MTTEYVRVFVGMKMQALRLLQLGSLGLAHLPSWMGVMERLYLHPRPSPMIQQTLLCDRSLSGLVDSVLRAQVVEV